MPARELMEWAAYERVYGSVLAHERIDVGFAQVCYYLVTLMGNARRKPKLREFLPKWLRDLQRQAPTDVAALEATMKSWADANDLHADG